MTGIESQWLECQATFDRAQETIESKKVDMRKELDDHLSAFNEQVLIAIWRTA